MWNFSMKRVLAFAPIVLLIMAGLVLAVIDGDLLAAVSVALVGSVAVLSCWIALGQRQSEANQRTLIRRIERLERRSHQSRRRVEGATRGTRSREETMGTQFDQIGGRLDAARVETVDAAVARLSEQVSDLTTRVDDQSGTLESMLNNQDRQLASIRSHLEAIERGEHGGSLRKRLVADVASLLALHGDDARSLLPVPAGWAMSPRVLEEVLRHVRTLPVLKTVVELGSGVSTPWIGRGLRMRGSGRLVSLEHDAHYADLTARQLKAVGLEELVELRCAPLAPLKLSGETFDWYQGFDDLEDINLLIVDGPPGATGPQARYPALPLLLDKLNDGCIVVLDDAIREDEQSVIEGWVQLSGSGRSVRLLEMVDRAAVMQVSVGEN